MNNPLDTVLFNGKTSSDVFKEIYDNSKKKDKQINSLIAELKTLIQNNNSSGGSDALLTDEELKQLQQIAEEVAKDDIKKADQ